MKRKSFCEFVYWFRYWEDNLSVEAVIVHQEVCIKYKKTDLNRYSLKRKTKLKHGKLAACYRC